MKNVLSTTAAILITTLAFGSAAQAQALRNADQPAEFPPTSFTGKQYVDSKGCVFVRAGFDGAVNWVPRVSRSRKVVCGFQPTFAEAPRPAPIPTPNSVPEITITATPEATPAPSAPAPRVTKPVPTPPVVAVAPPRVTPPAAPPRRVTPPRVVAAPPKPVVAPPRVVAPAPVAPNTRVVTACPGSSAVSQGYLQGGTGHVVRCGPQGTHPGRYAYANPTGTATVAPVKIAPPEGYRPAFEDDRFNPNRGLQTKRGFEQMRLIWTAGVPRRLIDQNTGRDMTGAYPGLRFPFINLQHQKQYVARHGWPAESRSTVTVATKNTPPARVIKPKPAPSAGVVNGHRYVQVGTFGVPANANASAARLQSMGLPVRVGSYIKKGKTYRIVLAGPFNSSNALRNGLIAARNAGFGDAFTRK